MFFQVKASSTIWFVRSFITQGLWEVCNKFHPQRPVLTHQSWVCFAQLVKILFYKSSNYLRILKYKPLDNLYLSSESNKKTEKWHLSQSDAREKSWQWRFCSKMCLQFALSMLRSAFYDSLLEINYLRKLRYKPLDKFYLSLERNKKGIALSKWCTGKNCDGEICINICSRYCMECHCIAGDALDMVWL